MDYLIYFLPIILMLVVLYFCIWGYTEFASGVTLKQTNLAGNTTGICSILDESVLVAVQG
jgi:hypothetical protein